jgi:hypothetical protein
MKSIRLWEEEKEETELCDEDENLFKNRRRLVLPVF